ncbi:aldo/keto reductase [Jeotgalibaca sp. MA1X17-3]|uniref:aldo/keto reductase n=1 Tax=Jeotgalibaca sp. MA1X17-3 TaxID=2908211 RepID=UPI001F1FC523|nr:aldo/keto reductase [Jeotgalibaca sp. MA1X17-3]UJF16390.1 aldo/keto reductase [Jeotgalibaca sp. MA1X17-3]
MDTVELANQKQMPILGYGTWRNDNPKECIEGVKDAISVGFTHIDCASAYENEELVGQGIKESGIDRTDLFITSKLRNSAHGYTQVRKEVEETLEKLGTDYLDLYLIHWPVVKGKDGDWQTDNRETWRAFEELYEEGILKSIGVSNFSIKHLKNLINHCKITPMVNQIKVHPGIVQNELHEFCVENNIVIQAYSPLAPIKDISKEPRVKEMMEKYGKTVAQLLLRFDLQKDVVPLTKTVHRSRMEENIAIFDFEIDADDMDFFNQWSHADYQIPDNERERG